MLKGHRPRITYPAARLTSSGDTFVVLERAIPCSRSGGSVEGPQATE